MSEKLYAFLLKLYPDNFRRTYGDEALRLVRDRARIESGFFPGLRLWLDLLLDLATSLPHEYRHASGTPMLAAHPFNGEPSFQLPDERSLNPCVLSLSGTLSAVLFWVCVFVSAHSGGFPALFPSPLSPKGHSAPAQAQGPYEEESPIRNSARNLVVGDSLRRSLAAGAYSVGMTAKRDIPSTSAPPPSAFRLARPGPHAAARIDAKVAKRVVGTTQDGPAQVSSAPASTSGAAGNEDHPKFEVVSIKRHSAHSGLVQLGPTPDGFRSIGLPMFGIFQWAYALPSQPGLLRGDQIEGNPGWLSDELYDVVAKVDQADLARSQKAAMRQTMLRAMLQDMLAERCKVVVHYGSKEAPVYDLVIIKGGPKFKQAETVETAELRRKHTEGGIMKGSVTMAVQGPNRTQYYAISMSILSNTVLSNIADRSVVDKTGLAGYYDLAIPSSALQRPPPPPPGAAPSLDAPSPALEDESIFAALEALGLRLKPAKGRVTTLVVDHVERPSEN